MRRSTKDNRRRRNSTATAALAPSVPNAELVCLPLSKGFREKSSNGVVISGFPDGRFEIHCTTPDAKVIQGDCQNEKYRLSPRPLSPVPDVLVADCNGDGPPHVLRTYWRGDDGSLIDLTHYRYHPQAQMWEVSKSLSATSPTNSGGNQKTRSQNRGNGFAKKLFKLFSFPTPLLRLLLWPIADFRWQDKLKKRRFSIQLTPSPEMEMDWDGSLVIMGNILRCVKLFADGSALVNNRKLRPRESGIVIPTDDLFDDNTTQPWIEWYGDMMIIRLGEQCHSVITYENGGWHQTELHDKTVLGMIGRDLSLINQTGKKFLKASLIITCVAIPLFIIANTILNMQKQKDSTQPQQASESPSEQIPPESLIP